MICLEMQNFGLSGIPPNNSLMRKPVFAGKSLIWRGCQTRGGLNASGAGSEAHKVRATVPADAYCREPAPSPNYIQSVPPACGLTYQVPGDRSIGLITLEFRLSLAIVRIHPNPVTKPMPR